MRALRRPEPSSSRGGCAGRSARLPAYSCRTPERRLLPRELGSADSCVRLDRRCCCSPRHARAAAAARAHPAGRLVSARSPGARIGCLGGRRTRLRPAADPAAHALRSDDGRDADALSACSAARRDGLGVSDGGVPARTRNAPLSQGSRGRRIRRQPFVPAARLLEQPRPLGCDGPGARARSCRSFSIACAAGGRCGQLRAVRGNAVFHVLTRGLGSARSRPACGFS